MSSEIMQQNNDYKTGIIEDILQNNHKVEMLMDSTVEYQEDIYDDKLTEMRDNLSREQRARLFSGESLESILNFYPPKKSKYYNTSDEAASSIDPHNRFEYKIGHHLLMFEIGDLNLNDELKTVNVNIIVYDGSCDDWKETNYTIIDEDTYSFAKYLKNSQ